MKHNARVRIRASGRVQGVFFRAGARKRARELGITGWARNLSDGRVELVAEGAKKKLEHFIEWCREGTPLAKVERLELHWETWKGEFEDFAIHEFPS